MDEFMINASRSWRRVLGISFGLGTQLLFALTVWQLFWFLRDGDSPRGPASWWLDALLAAQFAVAHSLLLLPAVRSWVTRYLPREMYGCLFCVATCVGLWLIFLDWSSSTTVLWAADGLPAAVIRLGFYGSWAGLIYSLSLSGFGYQTGWTPWLCWYRRQPPPRRELLRRGPHLWIRHPAYLSFLGLVWFTPRMTLDHAILTGVWTAYIFIGSYLKDQRLALFLGDDYWRYASQVPGYPLMFFGPLGRRSRPAPIRTVTPPTAVRPTA